MSDRRKRDRYNETWTKEEVTESLRKIDRDKKSTHGSGKRHHHRRDEDDHERRERRNEEKDDSSARKSRSRHHGSRERDSGDLDRQITHRPRHDVKSVSKHGRDDRHDKHRKSAKDDPMKVNGSDRRHRDRERDDRRHEDEKSHRPDKKPSRRYDDVKHRDEDPDRRKHSSREDYEYREGKHGKHESERRLKERRRDDDERERSDDRRKRRSERENKSRGLDDGDEERRKRRERRRKEKEDEYESKKSKDGEKMESQHKRSEKYSKKYHDDEFLDSRDSKQEKRSRRSDGRDYKDSKHEHKEDSSSTSSRSKRNANATYIVEKSKEKQQKENEYNYDDEEFEDYADDFEDGDDEMENATNEKLTMPTEMDTLMRAIAAENERANSAHSSGQFHSTVTSTDRNDSPFSQTSSNDDDINRGSLTVINFFAAKLSAASSKVKKKMLKRSKDLINLIQLDSVSFDILEMAPITEYNLYIKNYGDSNTKQASVQCNDDNLDQEAQTEIPDLEEKWSQHPPHDVKCSGGNKITNEDVNDGDRDRLLSTMRGDLLRLTMFMSRASKLIESILNEDETWRMSQNDSKRKSKLSFCEGYVPLQTNLAYLQGRNAVHVASNQGSSQNLIAVAFEPAASNFSTRIDRKGIVVVWDSRKPAIPEKVLVCDARPTYCSFGPPKTYILFVGTDDGCVLAYDLREPGVHHQIVSLEPTRETVLRSATYTTGYLEDGHSTPVVSIMSVGAGSIPVEEKQMIPRHIDRKNYSGLAFQLASLEEAARLFLWIVVEILPGSDLDDDLGLAPHGRIKLIRSLSLNIPCPVKPVESELQFITSCVQFSFIDPNNFYVGTDTGHIVHCTQYATVSSGHKNRGSKGGLVFFNEVGTVSPVTSIDINPFLLFGASLILAGYEDGSLRLYLSDREFPVITWPFSTEGASVVKAQWSFSRPSVFIVLDSAHKLHIWDLAMMHSAPIKTEECQDKTICLFSLSNSSPTRSPEIALCYEEATAKGKSTVEVHKLAPHFSQVTDDQELEQLTFQLQSLL